MKTGVVLLAKNEELVLPEWLAFHRAIGFDRIHVFDNESTDATARLTQYAAQRVEGITLESWPSDVPYVERQRQSYERGLEIMRNEGIEWCLFIDADEFMTSTTGETLQELLQRLDQRAAIALHWSFYGSNGHVDDPPGLVTENFLLRAPANFKPQALCKSLVRVPYVQGCLNGHGFALDPNDFPYVDCSGSPVQWESHGQDHVLDPWRINHYFVRSRAWWATKVARSKATAGFAREREEWDYYDRNEVFDPSAARYSDAVRREMERMGFEPPPRPDWSSASLAESDRLIRQSAGWSAGAAFGPRPVEPAGGMPVSLVKAATAPAILSAGTAAPPRAPEPPQTLPNVALGKRATQSSVCAMSRSQDIHVDAMGAVNGVTTGTYGFHTAEEDEPWWMVDLGAPHAISEVRIFNVLDARHRARHLSISTSRSLTDWLHAFTRSDDDDFGGADGNPLRVRFFVPPTARFIRIHLAGRSTLQLDEVEIYGTPANG